MDYLKTLQSFLHDFKMNLLNQVFPNSPSVKSDFYITTR